VAEPVRRSGVVPAADGLPLAWRSLEGRLPTVVFLPGLRSDMGGTKALHLEACCAARGQSFLRLDYRGHGESGGRFEDGAIGDWADDARRVVEAEATGPVVLVGSSMGGWIMLLVALAMTERVVGLVGVAAAPDFTEALIRPSLTPAQQSALEAGGRVELASVYDEAPTPITRRFLDDGRRHLLLGSAIGLRCPVRLIHGLRDADVPWETSLRLAERLDAEDVRITLVKEGGHRLSGPADLALLWGSVTTLLEAPGAGS
jgi:pimeloyl-ACP methyl ester carboxylesterase